MKLKYRFGVKGHLRLKDSTTLRHNGRDFLFDLNSENTVTRLNVTVPLEPGQRPTLTVGPGGISNINLVTPELEELKSLVRSLEGFLSLYGIASGHASINLREPELTWIPESKDERKSMDLVEFSMGKQVAKRSGFPIIEFAYAGQAVSSMDLLAKYEIPMYFYRVGRQNLIEGLFINAFYDFFFIIESLFANGKFKTAAMKEAFRNSQALQSAVDLSVKSADLLKGLQYRAHVWSAFKSTYLGKSTEEITNRFADLRGFLHHHSSLRSDIWHPDDHEQYQVDADLLGRTCGTVIQTALFPLVFCQDSADRFAAAIRGAQG